MNNEYYWSLILEPGWVQAAVWTIEEKLAHVISTSKALPWEQDEDLVEAANAALSAAAEELPESQEPTKTVFGVPPSWVEDGQIVKEHLGKIRIVCGKLSLTPSGFVVLPEALAHAVKLEEGSPLTGIIVGLGKQVIDVTLFRLGNLMGTVNVTRSVSLVGDVVEGLNRFNSVEHLPSRFLIYDGREADLEEAKQALLDYTWVDDAQLKFLHTPQIEIIDAKKKALATSLAGASELGDIDAVVFGNSEEEELTSTQEQEEHQNVFDEPGISPEDVGFVLGQDVQKMAPKPEANDNGFVIHGGDEQQQQQPQMAVENRAPISPRKSIFTFLNGIKLPKFKLPSIAKPHHPQQQRSLPSASLPGIGARYRFGAMVGALGFVFIGLIAVWLLVPKVDVAIYVSPRTLEENESITIVTNGTMDVAQRVVTGIEQEVTVSGEKSRSSTGKKVVGDKAKGKVTIRNGTENGIKLASGAVLTGPNDMRFVIDESASVSAAVSPSSPGSVTVGATAEAIGSEYNLAKGEIMKVSNYPKSEVDAVIDEDFAGGSSREVVVVSQADLDDLEDELTQELVQEGQEQLKAAGSADNIFVDGAIVTEVSDSEFSHKTGDEAGNVDLSMDLIVKGIVVEKATLYQIGESVLGTKVPDGFTLRPEQVSTKFSLEEENTDEWIVSVTYVANLLPSVDTQEVQKKIAGKGVTQAEEYLSTIPSYSRAVINFQPKFFSTLSRLPVLSKNISIEVGSDR